MYLSFTLDGQDVRMAYMDVAPIGTPNGESVVLLHGMNFFAEAWTSTIDVLTRAGFRVIAVDQIGFGRSSKPILHYSISLHAANTKRLLDHLGISRTNMVAHSMGGMVASRFAASYPEAVDDLVLINPIGLTDARTTRPWRDTEEVYRASLARDYAEILRGMRAYYVTWKPEYLKYVKIHYGWTKSGDWPRLAMVRALQQQAIYADPVVDDWSRIKARTLVIGGEQGRRRTIRHSRDTSPRPCRTANSISFQTSATIRTSKRPIDSSRHSSVSCEGRTWDPGSRRHARRPILTPRSQRRLSRPEGGDQRPKALC